MESGSYAVQVMVVGSGLPLAMQSSTASERPTYQLLSYPSMDTEGGSERENGMLRKVNCLSMTWRLMKTFSSEENLVGVGTTGLIAGI